MKPLYTIITNKRHRTRQSEIEVQFELFHELVKLKECLGVYPKVGMHGFVLESGKLRKCVFDIVVFWCLNHRPVCIIECKKKRVPNRFFLKESEQIDRYSKFGVPVIMCGSGNIPFVLDQIKSTALKSINDAPLSVRKSLEQSQQQA